MGIITLFFFLPEVIKKDRWVVLDQTLLCSTCREGNGYRIDVVSMLLFIILPGLIAISHKVILQLTTFQIHPGDTSPKLFPCWSFAIYFLLLCFLSQQVFNL